MGVRGRARECNSSLSFSWRAQDAAPHVGSGKHWEVVRFTLKHLKNIKGGRCRSLLAQRKKKRKEGGRQARGTENRGRKAGRPGVKKERRKNGKEGNKGKGGHCEVKEGEEGKGGREGGRKGGKDYWQRPPKPLSSPRLAPQRPRHLCVGNFHGPDMRGKNNAKYSEHRNSSSYQHELWLIASIRIQPYSVNSVACSAASKERDYLSCETWPERRDGSLWFSCATGLERQLTL